MQEQATRHGPGEMSERIAAEDLARDLSLTDEERRYEAACLRDGSLPVPVVVDPDWERNNVSLTQYCPTCEAGGMLCDATRLHGWVFKCHFGHAFRGLTIHDHKAKCDERNAK